VLNKLGTPNTLVSNPSQIPHCTHLIFPGVGHAKLARNNIDSLGLSEGLMEFVHVLNRPLLGICVGMQLLGESSTEGDTKGLGLFPFKICQIEVPNEPIPHMGWNSLDWNEANEHSKKIQAIIGHSPDLYFVHSYAAEISKIQKEQVSSPWILATTEYDGRHFLAAVASKHVLGFQFHVEKSGQIGLDLIKYFTEIKSC
jgi:glutamine amidotransferase